MSQSLALQIENAIAAALTAEGSPAPVDRAATIEYEHENMPAYNLAEVKSDFEDGDSTDDSLAAKGNWVVLCYAVATGGLSARAAVDPLIVFAHQQLQDNSLDNLCRYLRVTGYQCNYDRKSSTETIEVQINIEVDYDIVRGDPSQNYNVMEG